MLFGFFCLSVVLAFFPLITSLLFISNKTRFKFGYNLLKAMVVGVFLALVVLFLPIHSINNGTDFYGLIRTALLSLYNSMQVFAIGCDFSVFNETLSGNTETISSIYRSWTAILFVAAPIFTFSFILSLFNNISANIRYLCGYFKDVYVFSELNKKSFTLADDIRKKHPKAVIVFTDIFDDGQVHTYELVEKVKKTGAICFKNDILTVDFKKHSSKRPIYFFTISDNESENLNHSLELIDNYRSRPRTHLYVFSTKVESELLLTKIEKGYVKVRRINHVRSLINRILYENGELLFNSANEANDGVKDISALVIGMGSHGTEMVKALSWFCQMDGYRAEINAIDKDELAEDRFSAIAPELMSPDYNGVIREGEAQYKISIYSGVDADTSTFANIIGKLRNTTYCLVSLGGDDINITTAVNLRMLFERMGIHPVIQTIVYSTQQNHALRGIKNYRGQAYDIDFIGDFESYYTENVIIDSELEEDALRRHLKWAKKGEEAAAEDEFWTYEYNYRSSIASAIHMKARIKCGIPGADKKESELTDEERGIIEVLEHRRWNAYMRSEGYIFSGSKDKASRNDLAKMHHDLVDYASLDDETKRLDSMVGTD